MRILAWLFLIAVVVRLPLTDGPRVICVTADNLALDAHSAVDHDNHAPTQPPCHDVVLKGIDAATPHQTPIVPKPQPLAPFAPALLPAAGLPAHPSPALHPSPAMPRSPTRTIVILG